MQHVSMKKGVKLRGVSSETERCQMWDFFGNDNEYWGPQSEINFV